MYDKLILLHINRILNKLDNNLVNIIKIYIFSNIIPKKIKNYVIIRNHIMLIRMNYL